MRWIAPPEKDAGTATMERRLWDAADQLRANSGLNSQQYSQPVLGLIFLRFAEARFLARRRALETHVKGSRRGSRLDDPPAYHAEGVLYLAPEARFEHLLALPEQAQVGKALNEAMKAVERDNPELKDVLPRSYQIFGSVLLKDLLKRECGGYQSALRETRPRR
jgi:type I restriction enzyme M protein